MCAITFIKGLFPELLGALGIYQSQNCRLAFLYFSSFASEVGNAK